MLRRSTERWLSLRDGALWAQPDRGAAGWRWPRIAALLVALAAWSGMLAACGTAGHRPGSTPGHRPASMPTGDVAGAGISHDPVLGLIYPGSVTVGGRIPGKAADHAWPETAPSFAPPGCQFKCPPPVSQDAARADRTLVAPVPARQVLGWYLRKLTGSGWRFAGQESYVTPELGGEATIELARPPHADLRVTVYSTVMNSLDNTNAPTDATVRDLASWHRQFTVYHLLLSECSECRYDAVVPRSLPPPGEIPDWTCDQPRLPAAVQLSGSITGQSAVTCDTRRDAAEMDSSSPGHSCQQLADALQRYPGTLINLPFQIAGQDFSWEHTPGLSDQLISAGPYTSDGLHYQSPGASQPLPVAIGGGVLRVRGEFTGTKMLNGSLGGNSAITVQISAPCTSLDAHIP